MTSRIIHVGRGKRGTAQVITTTYSTDPDGSEREHVTLETPKPHSDTARLRILSLTDAGKSWRS